MQFNNNLQKSRIASLYGVSKAESLDFLEKGGKRATIGEIRTWNGIKHVKHEDGWVVVSERTGKGSVYGSDGKKLKDAEQHHIDHAKHHIKNYNVAKDSGITEDEFNKLHPTTKKELEKQVKKNEVADLIREWSGDEYNDEHINSIIESLHDEAGLNDKDLKIQRTTNWSKEKEQQTIENKVEQIYKQHRPGLEHADLKENDIKNIIEGMVRTVYGGNSVLDVERQVTPSNSPEIGKTKSGKAVYQDGSEFEQDEDWTAEDHEDAADHHANKSIASMGKMRVGGDELSPGKTDYEHYNDLKRKHFEKMTEKIKRDEVDKKGKKDSGKYHNLDERSKITIDGLVYKLELIKHPKDRYDHHSLPSFSVKVTNPNTGEVKVMPHAIQYHTGYDQGMDRNDKMKYYPNVAGYGTSNGGGYDTPKTPYIYNQKEHLSELFSSKRHYIGSFHKYQDSIQTFPKGTKNEDIINSIS